MQIESKSVCLCNKESSIRHEITVNNKSLTDLSYLREVAMGDESIVIETVETFLDDAPDALDKIERHFRNEEWDLLYKQAHKIKPNLQYMGIARAQKLILEIEQQAKTENVSDDMGEQISEFCHLSRQALEELSQKLEDLKSNK